PSAFARGLRMSRVALEPLSHVKVVKLFAPERPGERLALHTAHVLARDVSVDTVVELVRLTQPEREYVAEPSKRLGHARPGQPHPKLDLRFRRHGAPPDAADLGSRLGRINCVLRSPYDEIVEAILEKPSRVGASL